MGKEKGFTVRFAPPETGDYPKVGDMATPVICPHCGKSIEGKIGETVEHKCA